MCINHNIKYIRELNDLKQKDFGKILNTSNKTISGWENGNDQIPLKKIIEICNIFKVDINYILGITNKYTKNIIIYKLNKNNISEKLKNIRKKLNFKQKYFANELEVSQSTYSKYENGNIIPNINTFILLNKKFKVDISLFFR